MRQHYALGNKDRIIRLEFRLRYWQLYGETATGIEEQLSFSQIAAVRFTKDADFKTLIAKTIAENLNAEYNNSGKLHVKCRWPELLLVDGTKTALPCYRLPEPH